MISGYELNETNEFIERAEALAGTVQRWDEVKRSFDYALSKLPQLGDRIKDTEIRLLELRIDERIVVLYYRVNEEKRTVMLIDLMHLDNW